MGYPRFLLAAGASGSGKTLITCGILQAFCSRGLQVRSLKCGPDYIDPMFHSRVLGTRSRNLDTFFTDDNTTRYLFAKTAEGADISVMEGVMGFYDGLGGISVRASAYDLARATDTPVVLIVNCKGMSLSVLAYIRGFLEYQPDSRIRGVILNQLSPMLYPEIKKRIEGELGICAFGYVPVVKDLKLESRHLGLVMPDEIQGLRDNLRKLGGILEETLDLDGLLELGRAASEISCCPPKLFPVTEKEEERPVVAVARDEAFCFLYEDNLELLERTGARLEFFSPLRDVSLPRADGLLLCGGYPELYARELGENVSMRESIREAVAGGMPCMAECGGFMYLQQELEDMEGNHYPMAGAIPGSAYRTEKLGRFGYITLTPRQEQMFGMDIGEIRGHEFHYFDSTECGEAFRANKPLRKRSWDCIQGTQSCIAGFPHLYYYSNPKIAERFLKACMKYREKDCSCNRKEKAEAVTKEIEERLSL